MSTVQSRQHLRRILEDDRIWSAYALADLDPRQDDHSRWYAGEKAVVLVYTGLTPPILFAHGKPLELQRLFSRVPQGRYVFTLRSTSRALLSRRLTASTEQRMWRMTLDPGQFPGPPLESEVERLSPEDLPAIEALFADHSRQPDSFHVSQLLESPFFGIRRGNELISIAGTHAVSTWASVAAVGNVFTRPDQRGLGHATRASAAVVAALLELGIRTVVLNVAKDNEPAIRCFHHLGFHSYCKYHEGIGELSRVMP